MLRYRSTTMKMLTRKLAREVSEMPRYNGERPIKKMRLRELEDKLDLGLFYAPRWSFAEFEGRRYRVNGQHSSLMLSETRKFPDSMQVVWDEFLADSLEDVADLFSQFDPRLCVRSRGDVVGAHGSCHKELEEVTPSKLVKIMGGVTYGLTDGVGVRSVSDNNKGRMVHEHTAFASWVNQFLGKLWTFKTPVIAVMFRTYSVDAMVAKCFWQDVYDESAPDNDDPTRVLANFLRDNMKGRNFNGRGFDSKAFYCKCIHAWNAYRSGKKTKLNYFPNAVIPKVL